MIKRRLERNYTGEQEIPGIYRDKGNLGKFYRAAAL